MWPVNIRLFHTAGKFDCVNLAGRGNKRYVSQLLLEDHQFKTILLVYTYISRCLVVGNNCQIGKNNRTFIGSGMISHDNTYQLRSHLRLAVQSIRLHININHIFPNMLAIV